jgi:hypothetical protein
MNSKSILLLEYEELAGCIGGQELDTKSTGLSSFLVTGTGDIQFVNSHRLSPPSPSPLVVSDSSSIPHPGPDLACVPTIESP